MSAKFILSKNKAVEQLNKAKDLADVVSYSLKTNYEVGLVLEKETDCLFSVHSIQALRKIDPNRCWFFAQAWNFKIIEELLNLGCKRFVIDNLADLEVLETFLNDKEYKIDLLLRMRLQEHTVNTGKHFVFGFYSSKINELIPRLRKNKNINLLGVHVHRKTQNVSEWSLKEEFLESLSKENFKLIDIINIGGGLPSIYKNYTAAALNSICKKIKEFREWLNKNKILMIIEPGRFIAAPAVKLEVEIISLYDNTIVVNSSIYNSAMDTFVAHIRLIVENELENGDYFTLKGCTPDSLDIFRYKVYLDKPKVGDKIIFLNAGAYNFSTDFCLLPKLKTEVVR